MTRNIVGLLWIAIATTSCPELDFLRPTPVEAVEPSAVPSPDLEPYALDGELNKAEIKALLYLQFPQSYDAISERFGFPAYRDSTADYYKLPNGRWVAIQYAGKTATGLRFSDSGD
ncbi:hypothetical protein IQ260_18320 [Leptolyngbya cf. ectocarpi LEGE 11479]|uniref:Uncharacterized protein n=1 Tax=Leptolyngbya cf. ectocarpi LEGE 11479 TaxID=1828722 RepID=A0A928ZW85_LEPEC|nr:hypothetical protein [Leptolyngbya ectocarpi]MBE9068605.1 hypothetical protein [Leptolyngbya cf. ectocarpi LEGE 11479]